VPGDRSRAGFASTVPPVVGPGVISIDFPRELRVGRWPGVRRIIDGRHVGSVRNGESGGFDVQAGVRAVQPW